MVNLTERKFPSPSPPRSGGEGRGEVVLRVQGAKLWNWFQQFPFGNSLKSNSWFYASRPKINQPDRDQHWNHERQSEFHYISNKRRGVDFLMIRDGFHHEIRAVADVRVGAKEHRPRTDR